MWAFCCVSFVCSLISIRLLNVQFCLLSFCLNVALDRMVIGFHLEPTRFDVKTRANIISARKCIKSRNEPAEKHQEKKNNETKDNEFERKEEKIELILCVCRLVHIRTEWFQCANRSGWLRFCGKTKLYIYILCILVYGILWILKILSHRIQQELSIAHNIYLYVWRRQGTRIWFCRSVCVCGVCKLLAEFIFGTHFILELISWFLCFIYCFLFARSHNTKFV